MTPSKNKLDAGAWYDRATPEQRAALDAILEAPTVPTFREWATAVAPWFQWYHHNDTLANVLQRVFDGDLKRVIVNMPPRHGKALALGTPVATPSGWTTMGELAVGDQVFDQFGQPCNVVAVSPVWRDRPVYAVETLDGERIVADAEHEWPVVLCRKRAWVVHNKTTRYLAERTSARSPMVWAARPLKLPEADLPVDPYVLGIWLGDGTAGCSQITSADWEVLATVADLDGGGSFKRSGRQGEAWQGRPGPKMGDRGVCRTETLQWRLRGLNLLNNKHIPMVYRRASQEQRLALLQGLVDSDGYVAPKDGQIEFCSTSRVLADHVCELVASLGNKAHLVHGRATLDGRDCGPKYRVMFYMANSARLTRKAIRCRNGKRWNRRYINSVTPAGRADTVCIEVDSPSHLFLAGRSMLPTHNSEQVCRLFAAYWATYKPDTWVALASYGQKLVNTLSRMARENYRAGGGELAGDVSAVEEWRTTGRGGLWAVGVGGPATGKGFHLGIIDDGVKDAEEAQSEAIAIRNRDWYDAVWTTRAEPDAAMIILNTRWPGNADIAGYALEKETQTDEGEPERWHCVMMDAVKDDRGYDLPDTCTLEPDDRATGEPLCPARYPLSRLDQLKRGMLNFWWSSLFQQRPIPREGNLFPRDAIEIVEASTVPTVDARWVRYWDKAGSEKSGDYTAGVLLCRATDGFFYVYNVRRMRYEAVKRRRAMQECAKTDNSGGRTVVTWAEQEPGSGGKESAQQMRRDLAGFTVHTETVTGDKPTRAEPFAAAWQGGLVRVIRGPWTDAYLDEMEAFPHGKHDDQVDASGGAFNKLNAQAAGVMAIGIPQVNPWAV